MKLIILVLISLSFFSAGASAWHDGFNYRIPIEIDNSGNPALGDYQFNVSFVTGINESSIRIVNEIHDSIIPHWCENVTDGLCYELWFNVSVGSEVNNDYYIYYGNNTVSSTSDYDNTFTKKIYNDSGLVLELHADEGTGFSQTNDTSGHNNHGTLTNMNITGNTISGWQGIDGGQWDNRSDMVFAYGDQLRFDGINDYVNCGNDTSLDFNAQDFTFSWWLKWNSGSQNYLFDKGIANTEGYYFRINVDGSITVVTNAPSADVTVTTAGDIPDGVWCYLTIIKNGTTLNVYKNNIALTRTVVGVHDSITTSNRNFILCNRNAGGGSDFFDGSIDEVRVYNRSISEDEIYRQYIRSKYAMNAPNITLGNIESCHGLVVGAYHFYGEMESGLTDFRDSMSKYLVWGILFFAIGLAFTLFAKIKQTLIGGK